MPWNISTRWIKLLLKLKSTVLWKLQFILVTKLCSFPSKYPRATLPSLKVCIWTGLCPPSLSVEFIPPFNSSIPLTWHQMPRFLRPAESPMMIQSRLIVSSFFIVVLIGRRRLFSLSATGYRCGSLPPWHLQQVCGPTFITVSLVSNRSFWLLWPWAHPCL